MSNDADNAGIIAALKPVGEPNYLGSGKVVSWLIREWIDGCVQRRGYRNGPEVGTQEAEEAKGLARIFLGENPAYIPVPAFNKPGAIDKFLEENAAVKDASPELTVATALLSCLCRVMNILVNWGEDDEDSSARIEGTLQAYEQLFLGIP